MHKRIPSQVRDSDECVKAAFAILQHLWNGDYQGVWHPLEATEWREKNIVSMLESFKLVLRSRVMDLVERMYKDIEQTSLASLIGLDVDKACKAAKERHWVVEESTGLVVPIAKSGEGATEQGVEWVGGRELERIAKYAIYLQSGQAPVPLNERTL